MDIKLFFKTYFVDIFTLILVFILGVFSKNIIENFFEMVDIFESQITVLSPELTNQSVSALAEVEGLVRDFNYLVWFAFIFMLFVVPSLLYLFFTVSQSLNFAMIRNKVSKKYLWKSFIYGLPLLLLFFLIEGYLVSGVFSFLTSGFSLLLLLLYLIIVFLMFYAWYVIAVLLLKDKKINYKILYKKAYRFLPIFLAFSVIFVIILNFIGYGILSFVTDAFSRNEEIYLILIVLILLAPVQFIRKYFVKIVG